MSLSVTKFGSGDLLITENLNRPIDEIVNYLNNNSTESTLGVTIYVAGDPISADVMNQPLIEIRDHINSLSDCTGTLSLSLYTSDEDVTAENLNRPIDEIVTFINNSCFSSEDQPDQPISNTGIGHYALSVKRHESMIYATYADNSQIVDNPPKEGVYLFNAPNTETIVTDLTPWSAINSDNWVADIDADTNDGWVYYKGGADSNSPDSCVVFGYQNGVEQWRNSVLGDSTSNNYTLSQVHTDFKIKVVGDYVYALGWSISYRFNRFTGAITDADVNTFRPFYAMEEIGDYVYLVGFTNTNNVSAGVYRKLKTDLAASDYTSNITTGYLGFATSLDDFYETDPRDFEYHFASETTLIAKNPDGTFERMDIEEDTETGTPFSHIYQPISNILGSNLSDNHETSTNYSKNSSNWADKGVLTTDPLTGRIFSASVHRKLSLDGTAYDYMIIVSVFNENLDQYDATASLSGYGEIDVSYVLFKQNIGFQGDDLIDVQDIVYYDNKVYVAVANPKDSEVIVGGTFVLNQKLAVSYSTESGLAPTPQFKVEDTVVAVGGSMEDRNVYAWILDEDTDPHFSYNPARPVISQIYKFDMFNPEENTYLLTYPSFMTTEAHPMFLYNSRNAGDILYGVRRKALPLLDESGNYYYFESGQAGHFRFKYTKSGHIYISGVTNRQNFYVQKMVAETGEIVWWTELWSYLEPYRNEFVTDVYGDDILPEEHVRKGLAINISEDESSNLAVCSYNGFGLLDQTNGSVIWSENVEETIGGVYTCPNGTPGAPYNSFLVPSHGVGITHRAKYAYSIGNNDNWEGFSPVITKKSDGSYVYGFWLSNDPSDGADDITPLSSAPPLDSTTTFSHYDYTTASSEYSTAYNKLIDLKNVLILFDESGMIYSKPKVDHRPVDGLGNRDDQIGIDPPRSIQEQYEDIFEINGEIKTLLVLWGRERFDGMQSFSVWNEDGSLFSSMSTVDLYNNHIKQFIIDNELYTIDDRMVEWTSSNDPNVIFNAPGVYDEIGRESESWHRAAYVSDERKTLEMYLQMAVNDDRIFNFYIEFDLTTPNTPTLEKLSYAHVFGGVDGGIYMSMRDKDRDGWSSVWNASPIASHMDSETVVLASNNGTFTTPMYSVFDRRFNDIPGKIPT